MTNRDGTGQRRLVTGEGSLTLDGSTSIAWAPDGRQIMFNALVGSPGEQQVWIFAVPTGGGEPVRLVQGFSPTWSPDGRRMAYVSSEDGQVYAMPAGRRDRTRLTSRAFQGVFVRWSPDGQQIAVVSLNPDNPDAFELVLDVVASDGSAIRRVASLVSVSITRPYAIQPIGRLLVDW